MKISRIQAATAGDMDAAAFFIGIIMKDDLSSKDSLSILRWNDAVNRAGKNLGLDPRLVALVRFLARRAAEEDLAAALAEDTMEERSDTGEH